MSHVYTARPRSQASPAAAVALDFGLRVRVAGHAPQRTLFSGAESLSLQELCSELGLMISELRVRSFSLRHQLEQVTDALLVNVRCGFWLAGSPRSGRSRRSPGAARGSVAWPMRSFASAVRTAPSTSPTCARRRCADGRPRAMQRRLRPPLPFLRSLRRCAR